MPFMPRSVICQQSGHEGVCVEITNIGSDRYEAQAYIPGTAPKAYEITPDLLNYIAAHLEEISKPMSSARFAWVFPTEPAQLLFLLDAADENSRRFPGWATDLMSVIDTGSSEIQWDHRQQRIVISPPATVFHPSFYAFPPTRDLLLKWVAGKGYESDQLEIIGSKLLYNGFAHPRAVFARFTVPSRAIPIPDFESDEVKTQIRQFVHKVDDCKIDAKYKVLIVPQESMSQAEELIASLPKEKRDQEEWCCCLYNCDDPENPALTNYPLSVFHEDGSVQTRKMCRMCVIQALSNAVSSFFDGSQYNEAVLFSLVDKPMAIPTEPSPLNAKGEFWPQVPLGALLSALWSDTETMKSFVEAWVRGVYYSAAHTTQNAIAFCPEHPGTLFALDPRRQRKMFHCSVPSCYLGRCPSCCQWHQGDAGCPHAEPKKCPKCQTPTWKDGGCNHITCPCGCHWCYICMAGFRVGGEVYSHMSREHTDWYTDD
jgi:hypothetical protein